MEYDWNVNTKLDDVVDEDTVQLFAQLLLFQQSRCAASGRQGQYGLADSLSKVGTLLESASAMWVRALTGS